MCSRRRFVGLRPGQLTDRVYSIFDLNDPTNRDRVAMLQAGVAMVEDHPLTGVGPDMVGRSTRTTACRTPCRQINPHLHNVPMQIAAERGLPALALWLWFVGSLAASTCGRCCGARAAAARWPPPALGALVAMLAAGLFEYNFGDSEFLMLFLVLVTLPFPRPDRRREAAVSVPAGTGSAAGAAPRPRRGHRRALSSRPGSSSSAT